MFIRAFTTCSEFIHELCVTIITKTKYLCNPHNSTISFYLFYFIFWFVSVGIWTPFHFFFHTSSSTYWTRLYTQNTQKPAWLYTLFMIFLWFCLLLDRYNIYIIYSKVVHCEFMFISHLIQKKRVLYLFVFYYNCMYNYRDHITTFNIFICKFYIKKLTYCLQPATIVEIRKKCI